MSTQAPAQLFDNSHQESINQNPDLKTAVATNAEPPENPPQPDAPAYDPNDEEWADFDWENYHKRAAKRLPAWGEIEKRTPALLDNMAPQLWIARQLSLPVIRWITADLPTKSLWEHLNADALKSLKYEALRGFQQAPGSLRREPVQKRLAAWLLQNPDEIHLLLLRWALREPQPPVLEAVEAQADEAALKGRLPSLIRTFGVNAVGAAIAFGGKPRLFGHLQALVGDEAKLEQILETAPPYAPDEASLDADSSDAATPPVPDSQAAHFWQQETGKLRDSLDQLRLQLEDAQSGLAVQAGATAKIKRLEAEVDNAKKRETKKAAGFAKKLEQNERKWADKYEELGKVEAREERRVRALQTQIEALEVDNKRVKRQVRQGAQLREEERRKNIALQAQLDELRGDSGEKPKKPMDAVSSPPTTQDAPKGVVKVSRPSPLDEIFEWVAHGRRVRMTAREVRRLIDKNDEERVGTVMLELEALQESNPDLRRKFLERLSQAGAHYPRVLTHRTTRVLVDASNVARFRSNKYGKGRLCDLQLMRQELQRLDCWPIIFIADASLPHNIDQPHELREMARNGEILITDKGIEADEILAREARATGAYVVTNDAKFFYKVSPDYEPPRITFRVLDGLVVVDEF